MKKLFVLITFISILGGINNSLKASQTEEIDTFLEEDNYREDGYIDSESQNIVLRYEDIDSLEALLEIYPSERIYGNILSIDLSHNNITEIPADAFARFPNVGTINISYNSINNIHEDAFRHNHALQSINLNDNQITEIDPHTFDGLTIDALDLENNPLDEVTKDWLREQDYSDRIQMDE